MDSIAKLQNYDKHQATRISSGVFVYKMSVAVSGLVSVMSRQSCRLSRREGAISRHLWFQQGSRSYTGELYYNTTLVRVYWIINHTSTPKTTKTTWTTTTLEMLNPHPGRRTRNISNLPGTLSVCVLHIKQLLPGLDWVYYNSSIIGDWLTFYL